MRTKVNTYTQGEKDDSITGNGQVHLDSYIFQHKVAAQPAAVAYIMRPAAHGFQKRFSVYYSPNHPTCDDDAPSEAAVQMLKDQCNN